MIMYALRTPSQSRYLKDKFFVAFQLDPYGATLGFANKMTLIDKLGVSVDDHYQVAFTALWKQMETDIKKAKEISSSPEIWVIV